MNAVKAQGRDMCAPCITRLGIPGRVRGAHISWNDCMSVPWVFTAFVSFAGAGTALLYSDTCRSGVEEAVEMMMAMMTVRERP